MYAFISAGAIVVFDLRNVHCKFDYYPTMSSSSDDPKPTVKDPQGIETSGAEGWGGVNI